MDRDCLALDLGATRVKWALFQGGQKTDSGAFQTPPDPRDLVQRLPKLKSSKIAIAFAGFAHEGKIAFSPNLPGYRGFPLADFLSGETGASVILENDANLFTFGEALAGAGRGFATVLGLTLGTGIGGGLVIRGEIYQGAGFALEPGHMTVDPDGPPCACGKKGCLEALIGERAFCQRFVYGSAKEACAARDGEAWNFYGYWLGLGLGNLVNTLDPDVIVLGGGVSGAFELFVEPALVAMANTTVGWDKRRTRVAVSMLGDETALWGGYFLAENPGN